MLSACKGCWLEGCSGSVAALECPAWADMGVMGQMLPSIPSLLLPKWVSGVSEVAPEFKGKVNSDFVSPYSSTCTALEP